MKTFYSIISTVLNPYISEKISVAMILSDGEKSLMKVSEKRISFLRNLLSKNDYLMVKDYLKSVNKILGEIDGKRNTIFNNQDNNIIINENYFEYLSVYNHNVINFSNPVIIDLPVNEANLIMIYNKFIEKDINISHDKQVNKVIKAKEEFNSKGSAYFNLKKRFTKEIYPEITIPVTIDLYGKNERYVIGQFIDFERNINHIKIDYFDLEQIEKIKPESLKFIISAEPEKNKFVHQHSIWEQLRSDDKYEYVDASEVDKIIEYAELHNVTPIED